MDLVLGEFSQGLPDAPNLVRLLLRTLTAAVLGAVLGYERARTGKDAGLRTHTLVALGAALFVMAAVDLGAAPGDVSRVIQGVASGIGFIGAGAILKLSEKREIRGLTTAAGLWMTAAIGLAAGLGRYGMAILAAAVAWLVLAVVPSAPAGDDDTPKAKARPV